MVIMSQVLILQHNIFLLQISIKIFHLKEGLELPKIITQ